MMDEEGYHWFRVEDNGTGMTKEIIENHFLKIGSSYYASDAFETAMAVPGFCRYFLFSASVIPFMGAGRCPSSWLALRRF